ncbi:uncharacterized protein ACLA_050090 [Aspergillus clavatus NRRL 1]|uniref:Uncharacterized protein n=1 Tax=Aspergillus clavatus (strain ATCC 1007 / CBS 513.65 / DSM 816 / NCTC 3887 / NRRL 1 / QM 1276 / 107) TaxID=344612 RepID=A1CI32_ASPCL|nr:uncharacterized protein ACLA_050090 [Aspergillus clavatus NRRL 1]EAW10537.1 conserved hypothetical protein [Aspergillus clavatus NRRL 1]
MRPSILRNLATVTGAPPARLTIFHPSTSWTTQLPRHNTPTPPSRSFSQSLATTSSFFRLTSKPTTDTTHTVTAAPAPVPVSPFSPDTDDVLPDYSAYKPKRQWPPDMSKLSPKHQFRLERKYRRRAALKYARPKWMKMTKLAQWGIIGFVLIYALLFMEWDERGSPVEEIRRAFFSGLKETFSTPPPPRPVRRADDTARE